jgi:hypothetical protein
VKPCLPNGKLEEAKGCCERGECGNCGFSLLWSKLRAKIVHNKEVGGEMLEEFRDDGVHELWKEKMLWQGYVKRHRPVAGGVLTESDDEEYVAAVKTARDAVLQTSEGTLVDFLDVLEVCVNKHLPHRVLQSQTYIAQRDLNRNRRPGDGIQKNMDFSENPSPKNARLLQGDHWISLNFTLFISIYDWVVGREWNKKAGCLPLGAEVTVDGEFVGQDINMDSYWGVVDEGTGVCDASGDSIVSTQIPMYACTNVVCSLPNTHILFLLPQCVIRDAAGDLHKVERKRLRHRELHSVSFAGVTEDKVPVVVGVLCAPLIPQKKILSTNERAAFMNGSRMIIFRFPPSRFSPFHFLTSLIDSTCPFQCCCFPFINPPPPPPALPPTPPLPCCNRNMTGGLNVTFQTAKCLCLQNTW